MLLEKPDRWIKEVFESSKTMMEKQLRRENELKNKNKN